MKFDIGPWAWTVAAHYNTGAIYRAKVSF